ATQPNHQVSKQQYVADLRSKSSQLFSLRKSEELQQRLHQMATEKEWSPTALTRYLRSPGDFYHHHEVGRHRPDEVDGKIAMHTLGPVVHNVLGDLFQPGVEVVLTVEMLEQIKPKVRTEVENEFYEIYSQSYQKEGKNLLAFEVVVQNIHQYLDYEMANIKQGDEIRILALETKLETIIEDEKFPYPVKLIGYVDRIERRNGRLRIIDYKTGRVEEREVGVSAGNFVTEKKSKAMQLLTYA